MVVDDSYYKILEVDVTSTPQQIKKSYRKLSLQYHPDKNPAPEAKEKFQAITEAYQVLSSDELRQKYDKFGKDQAVPEQGFEDATEYFAMIFGGEAFQDYIGELTLLKDLAKQAELSTSDAPDTSQLLAIEDLKRVEAIKEEAAKKGKDKLTPKQREELEKYEEESKKKKEETRKRLTENLILKLSVWTESPKDINCLHAFEEKYKAEADGLKIESFGLDILQTIGDIYVSKGTIFLKSQRTFLGLGSFFGSVKEKAGVVSDTFKTISSALDAQSTMEELSKMQEKEEGVPDPSAEEIAAMEKLLMGKVLAAAWHGSKFEIQSTVRGVCDAILYDKEVSPEKRIERAEALVKLGSIFRATTRTDDENEEARIFEELVAEAQKDVGKKERRKNRVEREKVAAQVKEQHEKERAKEKEQHEKEKAKETVSGS